MFVMRMPKNIPQRLAKIKKLAKLNEGYSDDVMKQLAEETYRRLIEHLEKQDLNWKPLKEEYRNWKISQGLDERIWISTSLLKRNIKVMKLTDEGLWFIGIPGDIKYPNSDISVAMVASILEYGSPTRNIPPRPLFRTTRREMLKEFNEFIKKKNGDFFDKVSRGKDNKKHNKKY